MKLIYSGSIGVLTTVFSLLFMGYADSLRLDFTVAPKVEMCKSIFNISSCDLVAYFFVMCMELPQILCGLFCTLITIMVVGNLLNKIKLSKFLIACVFCVSYVTFFTLYNFPTFNIFIYIVVTAVIYSLVLLLLIKVSIHLTSHLKGQKTVGFFSFVANFSQPFSAS